MAVLTDGTFIKELVSVVKYSLGKVDAGGQLYLPTGYTLHKDPTAVPIGVSTLDSVVDFIKNVKIPEKQLLIVATPRKIEVIGELNKQAGRSMYIKAVPNSVDHRFSIFLTVEEFIMYLNTSFANTSADKQAVIDFVSSVVDNSSVEFNDNGIVQTVTAKVGITQQAEKEIPKYLDLKPIFTFPEVEQPSLPFILRGKKGREGKPEFALFTVEGTNWEVEVNLRIKKYLSENIGKDAAEKTQYFII